MKTPLESSTLLDRGRPTIRELLSNLVFNPVDGTIRLNGDRIVMQRAAVGIELRRELVRLVEGKRVSRFPRASSGVDQLRLVHRAAAGCR